MSGARFKVEVDVAREGEVGVEVEAEAGKEIQGDVYSQRNLLPQLRGGMMACP